MNKIFRIVWSQATQSWVAVSELTKAHKKQSSSNTLKAVVGSMVMMLGVNSVDAAVTIESTTGNSFVAGTAKTGSDGISIGINADTSAGANNVAIGKNAYVGLNGKGGTNPAGQSVAIGGGNEAYEGARAFGTQSVAIGGNTIAEGNSSIAIGNDDVQGAIGKQTTYTNTSGKQVRGTVGQAYEELTGKNINAEGIYRETKSGQAAVAIGVKAQAGDLSLALGTASTANQVNAVAIGSGATATRDNAVAIGGGATTEAAGTKEVNSTINNITYTWEGGQNTVAGDVVSFGRAGFERQLKHVAAGKVSKDSTDAINGSQLYGVIDGLTSGSYLHYAGDDAKGKDKTDNAVIKQSISNNRLDILGGADKATLSDNNIGVNNDGSGKLLVKLAKDLKDLTSTNVSGIVTNASGIAMADKKITGLANGDVSANSKEAVTGSQLYELTNKPLTFTGDTGTTTRKLGEATKFEGNADITTTASEGKVAFTLNKGAVAAGDTKVVSGDAVNTALNNKFNAVTLNTSGDSGTGTVNLASQNLAINGSDGIVTKAENQQVTVSLSDATKKKLAEVDTKIGNNDISLSGDKTESGSGDNTTTKVALNKTGGINFGIKGGAEGALSDKNIGVLTGTEGVTVKLAKELKDLKSIELKDGDKASKIDGNGITFTKGDKSVSLSNAGLNNGGNKITGVADGTIGENSTEAVNGAQIHAMKQDIEAKRYQGWKINSGKTGTGEVTGNASKDVNSTNEVKFIAGNNVKLVQDGLNMTIQTLDNVAFSKVTVGDVSIDAAGINAGNKVISNVADGAISADSKEAINGSQLHTAKTELTNALNTKAEELKTDGFSLTAEDKQSVKKKLGESIEVVGADENVSTKVEDGKIKVALNKDLKLNSVTAGDNTFNGAGLNVGGVTVSKDGIHANDKKITGLANGDVSEDSKEAVTGSQLHELTNKPLTFTGDAGTPTSRKLGETLNLAGNNDITTTTSEGKVAFTLNKGAVAAGNTKVVSGDAVNTALNNKFNAVTLNTSGDSGRGTVNLASQNLAINGTDGIVTKAENQKVTVSLSEATKKKLAEVDTKIGNNDISLSGDKTESGSGDNTTTKVALNKTGGINFGIKGGAEGALSDKNIGVLTGTEGVTVKLAKELKDLKSIELKDGDKASKIDGNGITFTKGDKSVSLSNAGLNNGGNKITGVADGTIGENSTEAVNGAQIHAMKQDIEAKRYQGWKINSGKTGTGEVTGNASKDVNSTNEVKFIAGNNVKLVQDGLNMTIQTLDNVAFSKVTVGDVSIDAAGINAGNKVISNVADGAISADSKEAINGSQLHTAKTELTNALNTKAEELKTDGFSLTAEDKQSVKKKLGESIEVVGADENVSTKVEDGKIKVALNKDLKLNSVTAGDNTFNGAGLNVGGVTVSKDGAFTLTIRKSRAWRMGM
ncbi:adhesin [Haemophilus haemolyticus]|uniref:ESPR-type extended signal peptide-containing protein n=1 Tax=Haemophilus haemolyticus TaxID=726 RepID=UPI001CC668B2|nr:ESPR-type extended signal peptide-containing protein [Haemophilus haemolyticus]BCL67430.1 adhesin [Haemophilus haemolyticus]